MCVKKSVSKMCNIFCRKHTVSKNIQNIKTKVFAVTFNKGGVEQL